MLLLFGIGTNYCSSQLLAPRWEASTCFWTSRVRACFACSFMRSSFLDSSLGFTTAGTKSQQHSQAGLASSDVHLKHKSPVTLSCYSGWSPTDPNPEGCTKQSRTMAISPTPWLADSRSSYFRSLRDPRLIHSRKGTYCSVWNLLQCFTNLLDHHHQIFPMLKYNCCCYICFLLSVFDCFIRKAQKH